MKKITSALAGAAMLVGASTMMTPASAAQEGSGLSGWLDGSNAYSNCYYETEPSGFSLQYVKYEKWCNVDFNPVTVWLRGVHDGGVYKVEEGNTDIYDKNFERTFNVIKPGMTGQIW